MLGSPFPAAADSNGDSNSSGQRRASATDGSAARSHAWHRLGICHEQGQGDRAHALAAAAQARTPAGVAAISASMMTSGQRIGVIFALLLGVLIVTSEFANQTAAVTFVTVPRRATVIRAKLAAAACCGALFWLGGTIIAAVTTPLFLYSQHVSVSLAGWTVVRPVLLSLLAAPEARAQGTVFFNNRIAGGLGGSSPARVPVVAGLRFRPRRVWYQR